MSQYLLAKDVAERLGVSVVRVVALGDRIPHERTPRGVRIYRTDAVDLELGRRAARAA